MIIAFSTSSSIASVALIDDDGVVLASSCELAERRSGAACLSMVEVVLASSGVTLSDVNQFAADVGPGSFTGLRVGMMLAKCLAWAQDGKVAGATSFDLISRNATVAIPIRKKEFLVRVVGAKPQVMEDPPPGAVGYGFGENDIPPDAVRFAPLVRDLVWLAPEQLVPQYQIPPSISMPKSGMVTPT